MKRDELLYSVLDDGHEDAQPSVWRERLSMSKETFERDLRCAVCAVDVTEDEKRTLDALQSDCGALIGGITSTVHKYVQRIPLPRGFFVGSEERASAYGAVCRMLVEIEDLVSQLQTHSVKLTALDASVKRHLSCADNAHLSLIGARQAAEKTGEVEMTACVKALSEALTEKIEEATAILNRAEQLQALVGSYLSDLIPQFLNRLTHVCDMEHDGKSCDPIATARLLSAFYDTVQQRNGGELCLNI